jgi:uncharacterized repeat protein (TIGR01451 family)
VLRRLATAVAAILVFTPAVLALAGCGSGNGQLKVSIIGQSDNYKVSDHNTWAAYKPGNQATFTIDVVNAGPGTVTGVTIHVQLPPSFHYRSSSIASHGSTRTQPLDAAVNSGGPIWGLWTLDAPGAAGTDSTGAAIPTDVQVTFKADVDGQPGDVPVRGFAAGDATAGQTDAPPYMITVQGAPEIGALVTVDPGSVKKGGTVTYEVRVTNTGTAQATNIGVLLTLPSGLTFASSVTPFSGNGSRNNAMNPYKGSLEVYYDGFVLPSTSNAGPGFVAIVFKANVVVTAAPGTYTVDCHLTDAAGDTVSLHSVAPITIS